MKTICLSPSTQTAPPEVRKLCRQLEVWRQSQPARARLPDELWELAATLARTHGVSRVARILGLSFSKLRQRLAVAVPAGFVELPPLALPPSRSGECVVELRDEQGGQLTLRFASDRPTLLALAADFWRRGQ